MTLLPIPGAPQSAPIPDFPTVEVREEVQRMDSFPSFKNPDKAPYDIDARLTRALDRRRYGAKVAGEAHLEIAELLTWKYERDGLTGKSLYRYSARFDIKRGDTQRYITIGQHIDLIRATAERVGFPDDWRKMLDWLPRKNRGKPRGYGSKSEAFRETADDLRAQLRAAVLEINLEREKRQAAEQRCRELQMRVDDLEAELAKVFRERDAPSRTRHR